MLDFKNTSHIIQLLDETVQLLDYRVVKLESFWIKMLSDYRDVGLQSCRIRKIQ